jgi:hypothetical protein
VRGLHRGDHAELGEPRNVIRREHLSVLNAIAVVFGRPTAERDGVDVERLMVGTIADRVSADLVPAPETVLGHSPEELDSHQFKTDVRTSVRVSRAIVVGLDQPGAT